MGSGRIRLASCNSHSPARSTSSHGSSIHSGRYALSNKRAFLSATTCSYCSRPTRPPMLAREIWMPCGSSARASSIAYVHTPPSGSTVIRIFRGKALGICVSINCIHCGGDFDDLFDVGVKRLVNRELPGPFHCCPPEPLFRRFGQYLPACSVKPFGDEIVKRSVYVAHGRAAFCPIKR